MESNSGREVEIWVRDEVRRAQMQVHRVVGWVVVVVVVLVVEVEVVEEGLVVVLVVVGGGGVLRQQDDWIVLGSFSDMLSAAVMDVLFLVMLMLFLSLKLWDCGGSDTGGGERQQHA